MKEKDIGYYFVVMASVVIVLAGVKTASSIIIPFLLSFFIAIILYSPFNYLNKKGVPSALSLLIVLGVFLSVLVLVAKFISTSAVEFSQNTEVYSERLGLYYSYIVDFANSLGYQVSAQSLSELADTKQIMKFISSMVKGMGALFTNGFVVILTVAFMLLEYDVFLKKVELSSLDTLSHIHDIFDKIKNYMLLKAVISVATAALIYGALAIIGTDYPFLWALLAFFLNFIPNIGSIIAAVPAVLITLVQLGFISAGVVAGLYITVNIVIGSIIEPKVMGKGLGVSTLVVFLSLIFWGWLLGIVGMFLSIPLTIMAKIIFQSNEKTKWIAILLDDGANLKK
ncbi:MAG: AI-2E family transporter [Sulfurimonas sp.]